MTLNRRQFPAPRYPTPDPEHEPSSIDPLPSVESLPSRDPRLDPEDDRYSDALYSHPGYARVATASGTEYEHEASGRRMPFEQYKNETRAYEDLLDSKYHPGDE